MSKQRLEQIASVLRQEINHVLSREFEAPQGSLISVTHVTVAPDLKNAVVYLSIIPDNKIGTALELVRQRGHYIQKLVHENIRMKFVPKLSWELDDTDLKYKAIDEALKN